MSRFPPAGNRDRPRPWHASDDSQVSTLGRICPSVLRPHPCSFQPAYPTSPARNRDRPEWKLVDVLVGRRDEPDDLEATEVR